MNCFENHDQSYNCLRYISILTTIMSEQTSTDLEEEWKTISGYPNYEVSNLGRIRNISNGRILKTSSDIGGYLHLNLFHERIKKRHKVHRLVAQEFIENPEKINHM